MKEILEKLSSYNLFNYLLPGIVFVVLEKKFVGYDLTQEDTLTGAFLYYFIGMVISRVGSVIIEPILKKISFLKFADYKNFVIASQKDAKIEILSEANNTYRTINSMLFTLFIFKIYHSIEIKLNIENNITNCILLFFILLMFLFAYRKQTKYITDRIAANNP